MTKSINRNSSIKLFQDRLVDIESIISSAELGNIISFNNSSPLVTESAMQTLVLTKSKHEIDRVLFPIIISACATSEEKAAGSGDICLQICTRLLGNTLNKERSQVDYKTNIVKKDLDKIIKKLYSFNRQFHRDDFSTFLKSSVKNKSIEKIIYEAIKLSGKTGKIYTKASPANETMIIQSAGYRFNHEIDESFLLGKKRWTNSNVKCIVIDGFIENISEVYHLLETLHASGDPCVIFARHMSPEVSSAILTNSRRGVIKLFPISLGFDDETINVLNDISMACNTSVISCLTGDLISSAVRRSLKTIDKIEIDKDGFTIFNKPSSLIEDHLSFLYGKLNAFKSHDLTVKDLYAKRIKSLCSLKVDILVGKEVIDKDIYTMEKIDSILRSIVSFSHYGCITNKDLKDTVESLKYEISKETYDIFKNNICKKFKIMPKNSIILPMQICSSLVDSFSNLGGIILEDR
tara:strand:+ start:189 stop:1580 length:1392 start_codon:yes stop_codon:yes gene_type:complete